MDIPLLTENAPLIEDLINMPVVIMLKIWTEEPDIHIMNACSNSVHE